MTKPKPKRPSPTSVRLPEPLRLLLMEWAARKGVPMNALIVSILARFVKTAAPKQAPNLHRKSLSAAIGGLGALATVLRQLSDKGLMDIFPGLEDEFRLTLRKIREACDAIISALARPGDLT